MRHSFVLMPHARRTHQPRSASNAINIPIAMSNPPSHHDSVNPNPEPNNSANAPMPRNRRLRLSILRVINVTLIGGLLG